MKLQKPKNYNRKPKDIYDRSDFRGLLHADYNETIQGAFFTNKSPKLTLEDKQATSIAKDAKRQSVSTKNSIFMKTAAGQVNSCNDFETTN